MAVQSELEYVVRTIAQTAVDREQEFGDLDAVVGDGDFGYSLARGFEKVLAEWADYDRTDAGVFLQKVALTISKRIGGTSGPIWGTAFLRAATAVKGQEEVGRDDVVAMLRAAAEGIKTRGNADVGDKTLLDALVPTADALDGAGQDGADGDGDGATLAGIAARAARSAAEATSKLQARRGRASYSGERSIGSPDAGAMAVAIMAEQIAADWPT